MIDLTLIDKTKTNAIVIRHAERDKMDIGQTEQPLNEEGIRHAIELGEKLKGFKNYAFFSSPVDRCQQTVEYMQKGIFGNEKKQNTLSEHLGKPGVFVVDNKNNAFKTLSCKKVVTKQIAREKLEGIRATNEGTKLLTDYVIKQMNNSEEGTLLAFITHDAIIAPVIFELTGEIFDYEHWPNFSDGFIIEKNNNSSYKVIRNGNVFDLKKDF